MLLRVNENGTIRFFARCLSRGASARLKDHARVEQWEQRTSARLSDSVWYYTTSMDYGNELYIYFRETRGAATSSVMFFKLFFCHSRLYYVRIEYDECVYLKGDQRTGVGQLPNERSRTLNMFTIIVDRLSVSPPLSIPPTTKNDCPIVLRT